MASDRRRQILLGALAVALALVVGYQLWPGTTTAGNSTSNPDGRTARTAQNNAQPTAPDVHIDALTGERPKPEEANRDLFKFKPKPAPPAPARPIERPMPGPPQDTVRSGPPPLPPIPLKFIGYIEETGGRKIASLSDGTHQPFNVVEGGTVLGQYKIWRIGVESLDISYLDGRGRQTIRMTGQ